jgi:Amidohydrolase family
MVTGRAVGGRQLDPPANRLDRETALRMWTGASSWFSVSDGQKSRIAVGHLADLAVLTEDFFAVDDDNLRGIESTLTLVGGEPVYGAGELTDLAPAPPPAMPDWSPVRVYGRYHNAAHAGAGPDMPVGFGAACVG